MNYIERAPFKIITVACEQEALEEAYNYKLFTEILEQATQTGKAPKFKKL